MNETNQSLEEILFDLAVQKPSAEERAGFLDHACAGNPALRAALDELLESHFGAAGFLPHLTPCGEMFSGRKTGSAPFEGPAQMLGRYKLLEKIGEGGFGEVWMAEQREPVKRRVAVKLIKLGMDSRQVVARFEAERQALAMMDHVNIARIFDADVTDSGRIFFVMELVRGIRITDYCDQNQLTTRERLDFFIQVCQAIQHAHQKGIIHRDIKPSNILVTVNDGVPVPKVIDFGIAKATQGELTDKTMFTHFQQFIGTPAYISPEQAEMSSLDIDTRADIYSLGVLLYELLVGQTPFDAGEMMKGGIDALRQIIREREPQRPSTKLNTLPGDALTTAGKRRQTDADKLVHQLKGDLDWIVLKCLEKDRARRYETANGLAMDIQRHLANEMIIARPPSAAYRLQKAWQRNKVIWSSAAIVAVSLVAGSGVSTWQAVMATRARGHAQTAQSLAQSKQLEAEAQRTLARRTAYNASLGSIQSAWEKRNYARVREMLASQKDYPEPSFEWFYWHRMAHLEVSSFFTYAGRIKKFSLSPDRKKAALVMLDDTIEIRSVPAGEKLATFFGHGTMPSPEGKNQDIATAAVFSPDGRCVASCGGLFEKGAIKLWDAQTGEEIRSFGNYTPGRDAEDAALPEQDVGNRQYALAFSPDGRFLASGGWAGKFGVQLWEVATGRKVRTVEEGNDNRRILELQFSSDGRRIFSRVTSYSLGAVLINDVETGNSLGSLGDSKVPPFIESFALSPDSRLLAAHSYGGVAVYDLTAIDFSTARWEITQAHNRGSVSFSPDGRRLLVAGNGDATIYDAFTGEHQLTLRGGFFGSEFLADSQQLIATDGDRQVKIGDAATNREWARVSTGFIPGAIARDGNRMVVHLSDGLLRVVDTTTGGLISEMREHKPEKVDGAAFSPDGKWVASGAGDGTIRIWNPLTGEVKRTIPASGEHRSVKFGPKGDAIISKYDREGDPPASGHAIWDIKTGEMIRSFPTTVKPRAFAISSDGRRLAEGFTHGQVRISDTVTGDQLREWQAHERQEFEAMMAHTNECMDYSADGRRLVTAGFDGLVKLWDAETGNLERAFAGHSGKVVGVHFTPDQRRLISQGEDGTVRIWDPATGRELLSLADPLANGGRWEWFVTLSSDGRKLVSAPRDSKGWVIWEAATPAQVAAWQREEDADAALWAAEQPKVEARRLARLREE